MDEQNILQLIYDGSKPNVNAKLGFFFATYHYIYPEIDKNRQKTDILANLEKFKRIQFYNMCNFGLVLAGAKPGCFIYINPKTIKILENAGYYIKQKAFYQQHYVSLKPINNDILHKYKHKDINYINGVLLGYLTPGLDTEYSNMKSKSIHIEITYKDSSNDNNAIQIINMENQTVYDKTNIEIKKYLAKYINILKKLKLPKQFTIIAIKPVITITNDK